MFIQTIYTYIYPDYKFMYSSRPYIHIVIQTIYSCIHPNHIYIYIVIQTIYSCIHPNHIYIYSHPRLDRYTSSTMSIKLNISSRNSLSLVHKP